MGRGKSCYWKKIIFRPSATWPNTFKSNDHSLPNAGNKSVTACLCFDMSKGYFIAGLGFWKWVIFWYCSDWVSIHPLDKYFLITFSMEPYMIQRRNDLQDLSLAHYGKQVLGWHVHTLSDKSTKSLYSKYIQMLHCWGIMMVLSVSQNKKVSKLKQSQNKHPQKLNHTRILNISLIHNCFLWIVQNLIAWYG